MALEAQKRDRAAHRMRHEQTRQAGRQLRLSEGGEVLGVAVEIAGARPGRQPPRTDRAALAAPIEAPYRDATRGEVAHRLELFLDELAKAADQNTLGTRIMDRQMSPTQPCPVSGDKTAPNKAARRQETFGE